MANENRLIDVNDVYSLFDKDVFATLHVTDIDTIPRVDAVEVVRCRECKYFGVYKYSGAGYCTNNNGYGFPNQKPDDFCSRGERKDNG